MKEKTIIVEIDEQGNSSIDLVGFQGSGCVDIAKAFRGKDEVRTSRTKGEAHNAGEKLLTKSQPR